MFYERRIICVYLILFAFLPFLNKNKDKKLIISWLVCSALFFIFPFLSTDLKDTLWLM